MGMLSQVFWAREVDRKKYYKVRERKKERVGGELPMGCRLVSRLTKEHGLEKDGIFPDVDLESICYPTSCGLNDIWGNTSFS
jgi:hypothetical protein